MIKTLSEQEVVIQSGSVTLTGSLAIPESCRSAVIFAHGSGSSRLSPRNRFVAGMLHEAGIGTLLFDLLTPGEDAVYENRFNIDLLTERRPSGSRKTLKPQVLLWVISEQAPARQLPFTPQRNWGP